MPVQTGTNVETVNHDHLVEEQTAEAASHAREAEAQIAAKQTGNRAQEG
jgi:hypothetical protein